MTKVSSTRKSILKKTRSKSRTPRKITFNVVPLEPGPADVASENESEVDSNHGESLPIPEVLEPTKTPGRSQEVEVDDLYDLDPVDEETEQVSRSLLSAVKKVTGVNTNKDAVIDEFGDPNLFVTSASGKISARELLSTMQTIKGTEAKSTASQKLLRKLARKASLPVPLETPIVNLAARKANYEDIVKILTRKWDHLVKSNRVAEQLVFPLPEPIENMKEEAVIRSAPRQMNEMESKINQLLHSSKNHLQDDKELTPAEEELIKSLSVEEAKARHAELQRMRALLSYQQAKLVRQSKIKSKQYRRILKRERLKNAVKDFEELKEKDPAAALEQLESWDKQRALERASLRHKNTGKFAKIAKLRSKYNDSVRDALEGKAQLAQQLLQRRQFSDDEEEEEEEDDENEQNLEEESDKIEQGHQANGPNEALLDETFDVSADYNPWLKSMAQAAVKEKKKEKQEETKNKRKESGPKILDLSSFVPDEEDELNDEIEEMNQEEEQEKSFHREKSKSVDEKEKMNDANDQEDGQSGPLRKKLRSEQEQRQLISEAFASDDVVADFTKDKEEELEKKLDSICPGDGRLPGWGNWAGVDEDPVEAKRRKRREQRELRKRKRLERIARKEPLFKSNVIINSNLSNPISSLKVKSVPYPFVSVKDYEAAILSQPVGRTFVPESSFRSLTAPRIVTKMGSIIKPMSEEIAPKKPVATVRKKKKHSSKDDKVNGQSDETEGPVGEDGEEENCIQRGEGEKGKRRRGRKERKQITKIGESTGATPVSA